MNQTDNVKVLKFIRNFVNDLVDLLEEEVVIIKPLQPTNKPLINNNTEFKQLITIFDELIEEGIFDKENRHVSLQGIGQRVSNYLQEYNISGRRGIDGHTYLWPDIPQVRSLIASSIKDRLTGRTPFKPLKFPRK